MTLVGKQIRLCWVYPTVRWCWYLDENAMAWRDAGFFIGQGKSKDENG
jgi:hypothetical protein